MSSTYEIYKKGTSQVITWLGKTAVQCGYEGFATDKNAPPKPKKNSKKKGVKGKQKASNSIQSQSQSQNQNINHAFPSSELPILATFISENFKDESEFKALPSILRVLSNVINMRKQWGKSFNLPDLKTIKSNERHQHFVTLLEEVHNILTGVMNALHIGASKSPNNGAGNEDTSGAALLTNMFAVLQVEESIVQEDAVAVPPTGPLTPTVATVTYELEDDMDTEDIYFFMHCFFEDFQHMRQQISRDWTEYTNHNIELIAVSVTTNVYFEALQRAEAKLLASLPNKWDISGYEKASGVLYEVVASVRGIDSDVRHQQGDVINTDLKDVADFVCLPVYALLLSFLDVLDGPTIPFAKHGHYGKVDMSGKPLAWRARFNQSKIILVELLPEFCVLNAIRAELPIEDELTRGFREMARTKKIPIWLVLACQVYLDVHQIMLSKINRPLKELQYEGLHVSKTLQEYANFSKKMYVENWPKQNDKIVQLIQDDCEMWLNNDTIGVAQKKLVSRSGLPESIVKPYSLLSRQPLLCGMLLFNINLRMQESGTILVNAWGSLPSILHLYNAVKHETPSVANFKPWEDLEYIIKIQTPQRIFIGDAPTDISDYLKRFCLVMGYSATIFAANRRDGRNTPQMQTPASKRGPRTMTATSTVADVFLAQYASKLSNKTAKPEMTFARIEAILDDMRGDVLKIGGGNGNKKRLPPLSMGNFLSSLMNTVQADLLALNIDYFVLHMRCIDLLRDIYTRLDSDFTKYLGSGYIQKENQLAFLVGYIFVIADQSSKLAEELKLSKRDETVTSAILMKAGDIMRELVEVDGSDEVDRIRKAYQSYGRPDRVGFTENLG